MSKAKAEKLFEGFTGRKPGRGDVVRVRAIAGDAAAIGELDSLGYRVKGKKRPFIHFFRNKRIKLLVSDDGNAVFIVGKVKFTSRGFTG